MTWGDAESGADSSLVQDQLKSVQQIQASEGAFAAILADGSVVTWGSDEHGGDSSEVQDQLTNVQEIQSAFGAFAAILSDGSVVTWGYAEQGGDSSSVREKLRQISYIIRITEWWEHSSTLLRCCERHRETFPQHQCKTLHGKISG